jgi:hypothetical protein
MRILAAIQGTFYLVTGIWPLIHIDSFLAVTGEKTDLWLVHTVGVLVAVIGLALCLAAYRNEVHASIVLLAIGSAAGLATIDVVFTWRGVISRIYLADAVTELVLIVFWLLVRPKSKKY